MKFLARSSRIAKAKPTRVALISALAATLIAGAMGAAGATGTTTCAINQSPSYNVTTDVVNNPHSMYNAIKSTGAATYYQNGYFGQGVDVAVIDTGVAPVAGLQGNVVYGPDLSFESQNPALANNDSFGHGTHMAGIIAGRDYTPTPTHYNDPNSFAGIAPMARVVSMKVGDSMGAVDVTQVIAAVDWAVTHRKDTQLGLNIRVISLSMGLHATDLFTNDALAFAVEQAWKNNIVVVASAGNEGQVVNGTYTGLLSPASNNDIIAVGSYDPATQAPSAFSSQAINMNQGVAFAAPGQSIGSLHVPGSYADTEILADCAAAMAATGSWTQPVWGPGGRFVNGSGTSQATAMAAGAAALVLSKDPKLNPDQVKLWLEASASRLSAPRTQVGWGALNLTQAYGFSTSYSLSHTYVTGGGDLDAARGDSILSANGVPLTGNIDWFGAPFIPAGQNNSVQNDEPQAKAWKLVKDSAGNVIGESWNGHVLTGGHIADVGIGIGWSGHTWSGNDWTGNRWSGHTWSGHTWSGNRWSGGDWASDSFTGNRWSGHTWGDFMWS